MSDSLHLRKELPILALLLLPFVALPFFWSDLPEVVPIHWDMNGEPDRLVSKTTGLLLLPCIGAIVYSLFWLIPVIDPKRRLHMRQKPLPALRNLLILVLTFLFFVNLGSMLGMEALSGNRNPILLGILLLFLVLGNYMPAIPPNYFMGVRTPWTLEDPDIWRRTHRLTGRIWVVCSLVLVVVWALLPSPGFSRAMFFVVIILMVLVPVGYSLVLYFQRKRAGEVPS
jgi:uncharacterized membrane protein